MRYTVTEFRKNIRAILDIVDRSGEVTLVRYGKEYVLQATVPVADEDVMAPNKSKVAAAQRRVEKAIHKAEDKAFTRLKPGKAILMPGANLCPHGSAKGFCKKADCNRRFAK